MKKNPNFAGLLRNERMQFFAFVIPTLALIIIFFLYPVFSFLLNSFFDPNFTLTHYLHVLQEPIYVRILLVTLETACVTTILTLLISYPVAYLLATTSSTLRTVFMALIIFPFWTSVLVRTYGWMILLGTNGIINQTLIKIGLINTPLELIFNHFSVLLGMIHYNLPMMVLPIYSIMRTIPNEILESATTLGAKPWQCFYRVYLPLTVPGIGAGCVLVFILSLGFFITPALLGGPQNTMVAQIIEQETQLLNWGFAAALSVLLLSVTTILYYFFNPMMRLNRLYKVTYT